MEPVKPMPRYRCDHCNKVLTKAAMVRHERICFFNPKRDCDRCREIRHDHILYGGTYHPEECEFCRKMREVHKSVLEAYDDGKAITDKQLAWVKTL